MPSNPPQRGPVGGQDYEFTFESLLSPSSAQNSIIEADPNPEDIDSQSLSESVADFPERFGRTYSSFRDGSYLYPNDPPERDRMDWQYFIVNEVFGGKLHFAPWGPENPPKRVLDIGTGTGIWAIQMGDTYSASHIVGIDLSPIQHQTVPPNVHFYIEDATDPWSYSVPFDYVHTRVSLGSYADYKKEIAQQAFDNLVPGGWLEGQEITANIHCDDGTLAENSPLAIWADEMVRAGALVQRPLSGFADMKRWYEEVGFVDVQEYRFKIPLGSWPKDRVYKEIGRKWLVNFQDGLKGFAVALFNKVFDRTAEQIELQLMDVRRQVSDPHVHTYHRVYVVIGRKPFPEEVKMSDAEISGT